MNGIEQQYLNSAEKLSAFRKCSISSTHVETVDHRPWSDSEFLFPFLPPPYRRQIKQKSETLLLEHDWWVRGKIYNKHHCD
ncbi:hypothetical protein GDO78_006942 [Eleutherodactylus coqui]|uniref:Uncharacterized protein n=1 Tax=Eleutherodactylus coqui TaxID=57060 RepID=A0A8J6FFH1_ELECQ|nr:hypothetical protein GDO78_006942 [Eleutherodactylus coqui]